MIPEQIYQSATLFASQHGEKLYGVRAVEKCWLLVRNQQFNEFLIKSHLGTAIRGFVVKLEMPNLHYAHRFKERLRQDKIQSTIQFRE